MKLKALVFLAACVAANAGTAATRAARHTMGSRQKQSVKGTVTTIVAPPAPKP